MSDSKTNDIIEKTFQDAMINGNGAIAILSRERLEELLDIEARMIKIQALAKANIEEG